MSNWDVSYKLGIKSIDEQHSRWIEMMKDLMDARENPEKESVVLKILVQLYAYAHTHFNYEEALFLKHGYSKMAEHKIQHQEFLKTLDNFKNDVEKKNTPMSALVLASMRTWLIEHINVEDKKYVEFLKEKGVE